MPATDTQSLSEIINPVQIAESVENAVYAANPFRGLVWIKDCSEGRSPTCKFPRFNAIETTSSEANPKAENAGPSVPVEVTAGAATANAEVVDLTLELTWEAEQDAGVRLDDLVSVAIPALRQTMAKDCFSNLQSAVNVSNYAGQPLNITRLGEVFAEWDIQLPNPAAGPSALVLHSRHLHQFQKALRASSASIHVDPGLQELFGADGAYVGTYESVPIFKTPLMPQDGPSDLISGMLKIGQLSSESDREVNRFAGIGLATWWGDDVNQGMFRGYRFLAKGEPGAYYVFISVRYGSTLTNDRNSRAIIAKAA